MASAGGVKVEPLGHRENDGDVEFIWGKKKSKGGKSKDVQFYESFTYDGVEYALYDCVYMHKEGVHPCIGKLIKIWENPDKSRKVKVHWFFRPPEILYYLKDVKVGENEIFLASGEGTGLANVNPLEAVAGKCNVVCISEDERNPQLSEEEIKMADYVFYRAFDVGKCAISVKMDGKIGGLDVMYVFNRKETRKASEVLKIASDQNGDKNAAELKPHNSLGTAKSAERGTNILHVKQESAENGNSKAAQKSSNLVGKIADLAGSPVRQDPLHADAKDSRIEQQSTMKQDPAPVQVVNSPTTTTVRKKNVSSEENDHKTPKDDKQVSKRSDNMVKTGEKGKTAKDAGTLDDRPSKRIKVNGSVRNSEGKGVSSLKNDEKVPGTSAILSEERGKSGDNKLSGGLDKNKKIRKGGSASSDRPLKRANIDNLKVTENRDKSSMSTDEQDDNKLPKLSALSPKDVERTQGKSFGTSSKEVERTLGKSLEVTPRPITAMARKNADIPESSRARRHRSVSSEVEGGDDSEFTLRFQNNDELYNNVTKMLERPLHPDKYWTEEYLRENYPEFHRELVAKQLIKLATAPWKADPWLVSEFYAWIRTSPEGALQAHVRRAWVNYSPRRINRVLLADPDKANDDYLELIAPTCTAETRAWLHDTLARPEFIFKWRHNTGMVSRRTLTERAGLYQLLVTNRVLPSSNYQLVSTPRLLTMVTLMDRQNWNIGEMIYRAIRQAALAGDDACLPFPGLITRLCRDVTRVTGAPKRITPHVQMPKEHKDITETDVLVLRRRGDDQAAPPPPPLMLRATEEEESAPMDQGMSPPQPRMYHCREPTMRELSMTMSRLEADQRLIIEGQESIMRGQHDILRSQQEMHQEWLQGHHATMQELQALRAEIVARFRQHDFAPPHADFPPEL